MLREIPAKAETSIDELATALDAAVASHASVLEAARALTSEPFVRDLLDRFAERAATHGLLALARSILDDQNRAVSDLSNVRSLEAQRVLREERSRTARAGGDSA